MILQNDLAVDFTGAAGSIGFIGIQVAGGAGRGGNTAAILVFIDYWNMVEQPLILLSDAEMHPLSVFLSKINSGEIGLAFAVATIYMVPSLLVFLYGEEYLVDGITYQGGVKG